MNSRSGFKRASRHDPCPVCGKPDNCSISTDGAIAICARVGEGAFQTARNGAHLHRLRERDDKRPYLKPVSRSTKPTPSPAPIDRRHKVYTALLNELPLDDRHADDLQRRGLHDAFIANNLFASVPSQLIAGAITARLADRFDLAGVPGFYREAGEWQLSINDWLFGYFIPVRDLAGRIQALQIRRDEVRPRYCWLSSANKPTGVSSGAPVHFAAAHRLESGRVIITEGALKSEIIAQFTNSAVIGIAGVSSFKPSIGGAVMSLGVTHTRIAFDADWRDKREVRAALERLGIILRRAGLSVSRLDWSPAEGKGLDDLLAREVV